MKNVLIRYFFLLLLLLTENNVFCQTVIYGEVVKVSDGDTFTMEGCAETALFRERVRLQGIDAPEGKGNQPYWQQSRNFLAKLIDKKIVKVTFTSRDQYGRILGTVSVEGCDDVNLEMIKSGLAWHYSYFDNTKAYAEAELFAKTHRLGLWADDAPVNPYQWRKEHKKPIP